MDNFRICTVHPAIIRVFYYQLMHKRIVLKGVLKFTLKLQQLQHVPVWSPSSGSVLCELAEVTLLKLLVKIYYLTKRFNSVTLASSYNTLPDDGDHTETCWS